MAKKIESLIEEISWQDAREVVANTCKELADIIDDINPGKECTLFKVRYPFGMKILEDTIFYLPFRSPVISIPITDPSIPSNIRNQLNYSALPLGIIVQNNIEVFRDLKDKIYSVAFYGNGLDIGIWEYYNWTTPYSITSGARSLYMLPKISESFSHKQLKKEFGVTAPPPRHTYDHWEVFTQIANSKNFSTPWFCEVLFLTKKWFDNIKNNKNWAMLRSYICTKGWQHSGYGRRKSILDVAWEMFARSLSSKEFRADSQVVDTLKHLVNIGSGTVPASAPYAGIEVAGPLKEIQTIYEHPHSYGLKYIATIMQPQYFSHTTSKPVYYSAQMPTLLETVPRGRKAATVMNNIRELSDLVKRFLTDNDWNWSKLKIADVSFCELLNDLKFEYFHGEMFAYGRLIRPSTEMPNHDSALIYDPYTKGQRGFANNGTFLRGCVKISKQELK